MLVTSIFSFSQIVFKSLCPQGHQKLRLFGKELKTLRKGAFEYFVGKGYNAGNQHFLLFPQLPTIQRHIPFAIFNLLSKGTFNIDRFKILMPGQLFTTQSRLLMALKWKPFENIVGKGENAVKQHFLPFPQCFLPFPKQISIFQRNLILSQTTNFRLFQTERFCRRQFQIWWKWKKNLQRDRKHCGKRRNCSLWAISLFPHSVFKRPLLQTPKHQGLLKYGNYCNFMDR